MPTLSSTLASANDSHSLGMRSFREHLVDMRGILRGMDDSGMVLWKSVWNPGSSTCGDDNILGLESLSRTRFAVVGVDVEVLHGTSFGVLGPGTHALDILTVVDHVVEVLCTPPHVVLVLDALWQECVQVGECNQSVLCVKVVQEGELTARISQRGHVLQECDLHLGSGKEHTGVPCELVLLFQESNSGCSSGKSGIVQFQAVVKSHCNGERSRAESAADQVLDLIVVESLQIGSSVATNRAGNLVGRSDCCRGVG